MMHSPWPRTGDRATLELQTMLVFPTSSWTKCAGCRNQRHVRYVECHFYSPSEKYTRFRAVRLCVECRAIVHHQTDCKVKEIPF